MKKPYLLFLIPVLAIFSSCTISSGFNKQKYTNLKQIKPIYEKVEDVNYTDPADQDSPPTVKVEDSEEEKIAEADSKLVQYTKNIEKEVNSFSIESLSDTKKDTRRNSEVLHHSKRRIELRDNEKPDWKKARNNGFLFLGLAGLLVGLGLLFSVLFWTEIIMWFFAAFALAALVFAFVYWAQAIDKKEMKRIKNKNLFRWMLWLNLIGPGVMGLCFLLVVALTFTVWFWIGIGVLLAAVIAEIILLILSFKEPKSVNNS
ncbi:MAG: hypothetical protein HUJ25_07885 [Crocinitomicaceae bacterium]|nr:hypothetical protein [Crocinitomicaceae bacterium]